MLFEQKMTSDDKCGRSFADYQLSQAMLPQSSTTQTKRFNKVMSLSNVA